MDKNKLLEILNDWNFWDKEIPNFIVRKDYQKMINTYSKSDEIIVFKGIRRSGKSTLMINNISELVKKGVDIKEILLINFEDPRFTGELNINLLQQILDVYQEYVNNDSIPYIFLDEIQNIQGWEKWVRTIYDLKKGHLFITGSSSKLLSKEFGTSLSGRFLDIVVTPLSFKEYLSFLNEKLPDEKTMITKKIIYKKAFNNYNKEGGFPKVVLLEPELKKKELLTYYETIILKDIVARHNLKNYDNVKKVALYLLSNMGVPLNLNKVRISLNISYDLVEKYFEYLKDTFLIFEINQFDFSLKKQFSNRRKVYCIDNGLLEQVSFKFSENYGRYIENIVFLELQRKGLEVYFHAGKKECDFILKEGLKITQAIQVTRSLNDVETRKREIDGLLDALHNYELSEGLILTEDEEDSFVVNGKKVVVMPVWKWLLE